MLNLRSRFLTAGPVATVIEKTCRTNGKLLCVEIAKFLPFPPTLAMFQMMERRAGNGNGRTLNSKTTEEKTTEEILQYFLLQRK